MKILDNMESCYGCGACFNVCPTGAISMEENAEGFLEPVVDAEKCISCGKCRQVCPSLNCQYSNDQEHDIFAFSAEEKVLYNSSSGGIFTFLAEHILTRINRKSLFCSSPFCVILKKKGDFYYVTYR